MAFFHSGADKGGTVYLFVAIEAFNDYGLNPGIERGESPESILRSNQHLMENKGFFRHRDKGFTLVVENYDKLRVPNEPSPRQIRQSVVDRLIKVAYFFFLTEFFKKIPHRFKIIVDRTGMRGTAFA